MSSYLLSILTPSKRVYTGEAVSLIVTCEKGQLAVLKNHAPMVVSLVEGPLTLKTEKESLEGIAGQGVLRVDQNRATVMVHSFRWADEETAEDTSAQDTADEDDWLR